VDDGKANLARRAERAAWFERKSIQIGNGDWVAVAEPWDWPNAFDGVSPTDAARARAAVGQCERPPREDVRSPEWVGYVVGKAIGLSMESNADKSRVKEMVRTWIASGVLALDVMMNPTNRREVRVVVPGPNDPTKD